MKTNTRKISVEITLDEKYVDQVKQNEFISISVKEDGYSSYHHTLILTPEEYLALVEAILNREIFTRLRTQEEK